MSAVALVRRLHRERDATRRSPERHSGGRMTRGRLVPLLVLGLLAAPLGAETQQIGKAPRIGVLSGNHRDDDDCLKALRSGFSDLGYSEGKTYSLEVRWSEGSSDFSRLAPDLVATKPDLIVAFTSGATEAAKRATSTIPIVMAVGFYPVERGYIASFARPGGNITGLALFSVGLMAKRLQLLREAAPRASQVAFLLGSPASSPITKTMVEELEKAAAQLGVRLHVIEVQRPEDFPAAFQTAVQGGAQAVMLSQATLFAGPNNRSRMAELALKHRLPSLSGEVASAEAGTLIFHGPNILDACRRAANYVDKILKGAKPADLPIEQPTKYNLVINMKTAKALGLTIPQSLLLRADQVIE
jgi:putative ABC transport system substrate-binding protein